MSNDIHAVADDHAIDWLIDHLKGQMPSQEAMLAMLDRGEMGPDITVPAVHKHILLSAFAVERLTAKRARMTFGAQIARIAGPSEFTQAYAVRSCATAIVDALRTDITADTRKACIRNVEARIQLLPLAPLEAA